MTKTLRERYLRNHYSYSAITSAGDCLHSWYRTYILGERVGNKFTSMGSVFHDVAEAQGKKLKFGKLDEPDLISYPDSWFYNDFNKQYFNPEKVPHKYFADKDDYIAMYDKGITALTNYLETYRDKPPLFVELKFETYLAEDLPKILGYIDRIDGEQGNPSEWIVTDYKTGSNPKSKDFLRTDTQLATYALSIKKLYGEFPRVVQYYHPVPDKFQIAVHQGDGLYTYTNQRNPVVSFSAYDAVERHREVLELIVEAIESNTFGKTVEYKQCGFCFHKERCKPFDKAEGWDAF